ncbi:choline/carnitine O-acyltransferase [Mycobacterium gordonae]|uniref:choline/carnitine O-acyltransferase n=1 Tax=Mycobacterium gordonae TaxID=1778 RepID=UPI00210A0631|nr:choline/carnitine O-acyltransferase [Mycobacterium gordonae]MCQ4365325.1 choline/carnitine O-acyltransferase [Mycobacterium gordonae]
MRPGRLREVLLRRLLLWQGWLDAPDSQLARAWGALVRALSVERGGPGCIDQFQQVLPHLPLPTVEQTLQTFVASVGPVLDDAGRAEVHRAADEFRCSPVAHRLQLRLDERRAGQENWLAEYWERYAYFIDRRSLLYSSGYAVDAATLPRPGLSQHQRAAMICVAMLDFRRRLAEGHIRPQRVHGLVPLCMKQAHAIWATVRLPGVDVDTIKRFEDQRCIVVLAHGHFFEVEVVVDRGRRDISYAELLATLTEIDQVATALEHGPPIAALTFEERTVWSLVRKGMIDGGGANADNLDRIERALFVVVLDEAEPESLTELGRATLCGSGVDRWLDKSMHLVVFANGRMGGLMEHSRGDGEAVTLLLEHVLQYERRMATTFDDPPASPPVSPRHLEFEVAPGSALATALEAAVTNAHSLLADVDIYATELSAAGAAVIKAADCSPDSFVQLALQLAYARLHPERGPCLTYQTATTRLFAGGRTECLRSTSAQSVAFVTAMMDPSSEGPRLRRLLHAAIDSHRGYRLRAMRGLGCDRHLLGLCVEALQAGEDIELFRTQAWQLSFELATSQSPIRQTASWQPESSSRGVGFLPTSPTGYGVSYAFVGDAGVHVFVSTSRACDETSAQRFCAAVGEALRDMMAAATGCPVEPPPQERCEPSESLSAGAPLG